MIMSVDAHCLASGTASALGTVSVALSGEVTNRLSNPPGPVHHGKMARLTAGNGTNRRAGMASDAGLRGEMRAPGQISRRGCLFALLALVITAAMLTWAALFALHRSSRRPRRYGVPVASSSPSSAPCRGPGRTQPAGR